jgi:hypothetical protein
MPKIDLLITADKVGHLDRLAKSLEDQGLEIRKTFPRSGTIVGTGDSSMLESLKTVEGVEDIRQEESVRLPPMDESIPQ